MFYFGKINGKNILKSDLIKGAEAFFTSREICICDKNPNLSVDSVAVLEQNKAQICDYLGIDSENLILPVQTHSANIELASAEKTDYPDTDALILTDKNVGVFLNFADCTPIILYDEKQNIGAVIHAGWRGTAQNIATKTVNKMVEEYGAKSCDISALIGPAIGFCCYNVGEEVFSQLSKTVKVFSGLSEIRGGNIFVDLKNINKQQLLEVGVKNIDVTTYCTVCNNDLFYSYRNENATTKRHSAVLRLKR